MPGQISFDNYSITRDAKSQVKGAEKRNGLDEMWFAEKKEKWETEEKQKTSNTNSTHKMNWEEVVYAHRNMAICDLS